MEHDRLKTTLASEGTALVAGPAQFRAINVDAARSGGIMPVPIIDE